MWRLTVAAVGAGVAASALIACGQAAGTLGQNEQIAKTCPKSRTLAAYVADDGSGSDEDRTILATRESAITSVATRVADCGGHLRVVVFSAGAASTVPVFDGDLKPSGSTQIARLRRVPALVSAAMHAIDQGLTTADQQVPKNGSDIVSQFQLAEEYVSQLNATDPHQLDLELMTDGVQTEGVILNTSALTPVVAADLAERMSVTTLPAGSTVTISGIGKTTGSPPPTSYVNALKTFYDNYCRRTGASCQVVTDFEGV